MRELRNCYFKTLPGEEALMSGLQMPDPEGELCHFIRCDIHPRLWEAVTQIYKPKDIDSLSVIYLNMCNGVH